MIEAAVLDIAPDIFKQVRVHVPPTHAEMKWVEDLNALLAQLRPETEIDVNGDLIGVLRIQPAEGI